LIFLQGLNPKVHHIIGAKNTINPKKYVWIIHKQFNFILSRVREIVNS